MSQQNCPDPEAFERAHYIRTLQSYAQSTPRDIGVAPIPTGLTVKYIDEYRDPDLALQYADGIAGITTRPWTLMEVCGGQTHSIVKFGIDDLLPKEITLMHGPGCPVCVTPLEQIDKAIHIASRPEVIFCSFGDMLRVPGSDIDLLSIKAAGGDVRIVYSPLDALKLAIQNPDQRWYFSRWASRRPPRPTPWPSTRRNTPELRTFRSSCPTCSCRPPCGPYSPRLAAACRASSRRGTSALSWATPNTSR